MSLTRRILFIFVALLYLFPAAFAGAQAAPAYTSIVVIGDSLSDTGNDATVSAALYTVNAQVPGPATGYTNGRFTDGTDTVPAAHNYTGVWVEQLAALLNAKPAVKNSLAGGTNYAYGFATTDVGTSAFTYGPGNALSFNVNNMGLQLSTYLATNPTINNKTLFVIWGGANDLIAATTSAQITAAAARDAGIVQQLITAGATDFIIPNLPPLGLVPRYNGTAAGAAQVNAAAAGYDQALAAYLAALPAQNPGKTLHLYQLDTYTLFNTIVALPSAKGLANVTASSQGLSTVNPDTYLFWDDLHPTTYGHSLIAASALALIGTPVVTTTTLVASNNSLNPGASLTLTASVAATSGTPMGTVTFLDGPMALGSALVTGTNATGTASFTTSFPTIGSHTITASFAGVNGYSNSTSASTPVNVLNPALNFSLFLPSITIGSGSSGMDSITLTPVGGFTGTATLACGTLPAHFSCSITPSTETFTSSSTMTIATMTIGTSASASVLYPARPGSSPISGTMFAFAFPGIGLLGFAAMRRRRATLRSITLTALLTILCGASTMGLTGCAGGGNNNAAKGNYTVPALITVNGITTSLNVAVTVQ
jgi:phospholipase/lecithinase/hemolysin